MDLGLAGRRALVAGGSAGIGRAIALALSREGADVAVLARRPGVLTATAREIAAETGRPVHPVVADFGSAAAIPAAVDEAAGVLGGLDVLVNSVPAPVFGPFMDHTDADWAVAVELKLLSYVRAMRAAVPHLRAAGGGVVVNVIGIGGKTYVPHHSAGGASNAALMLTTTALATELGDEGIRVVGVNPGSTPTRRFDALVTHLAGASGQDAGAVRGELHAAVPAGRAPTADQVADVAVFLASPRAYAVNGTTVQVDGGGLRVI